MSETLDVSVLNDVRKVGADFSFSNTLLSNVNNIQFATSLMNSHEVDKQVDNNLVNVLSAIGDQLGSKIYDEILNYIDNIGNVDICKIQALQTMVRMLGISYSAFAVINDMPLEIQDIMNVMSITPEYLLRSDKIYSFLTSYISEHALSSLPNARVIENQLSGLSAAYSYDDNISSNISAHLDPYISIQRLDDVISSMYMTQINAVLLSSYYDFNDDGSPILSTNIISCDTPGYRTYSTYMNNDHQILIRSDADNDKISRLKKYYNLPFFNEVQAANDIEQGVTKLDDYTTYQQEIIDVELERRAKAYNYSHMLSRNAYYRAQHVQKYIDFVESMFSIDKLSVLEEYDVDKDYILFKRNTLAQLLSAENDEGYHETVDNGMIESTAQQLMTMTRYIRELRHKIKTQAQKNSMKGTFIFLNFIVNEYLRENIITNKQYFGDAAMLSNTRAEVELVEYIDPTNYYNISTDVDVSANSYMDGQVSALSGTLNPRYWENDGSVPVIVPSDNTNIFAPMNTVQSKSTAFSDEAISAFYIDQLNNWLGHDTDISNNTSASNQHLNSFLCAIFDVGADKTYKDADGNLCCFTDIPKSYYQLSSKIYNEISTEEIKTNDAIAAYKQSIIQQIANLTQQTNDQIQHTTEQIANQKLSVVQDAQNDIDSYIAKYNNGTLSDLFTIDISQLDPSQIATVSNQLCVSLVEARQDALTKQVESIYEMSASCYADAQADLCSQTFKLSDDFNQFKDDEIAKFNDLSNSLVKQLNDFGNSQTSDFIEYKKELYFRYSGLSAEDIPFYYYPNKIHPSYQIHPYLKSFIETYDYSYIIENMPVLEEQTMFELLQHNLDQYIDDNGYLLSIWNNPLNSNSDYLTHYERVPHFDNSNKVNCLYGYDGLFYPTAVDDYLNNVDSTSEESISAFIDRWYDGLNVSDTQRQHISEQLSVFNSQIAIAAKGFNNTYYDIYRYGKDVYGNMYILLKNYGLTSLDADAFASIAETTKKKTPGSLWVRLKNHPIAFPAYYFTHETDESNVKRPVYQQQSQIDYDIDKSNTVPFYACYNDYALSDGLLVGDLPAIYDFFISQDKTQIEMYLKYKHGTNLSEENFAVAIANITQSYNYNKDVDRYQLFLESVRQKDTSKKECENMLANEQFVDFVNYDYSIGYVSMLSSAADPTDANDTTINVTAKQRVFNDPDIESSVNDVVESSGPLVKNFKNTLDDLKVDVCNGKMYFSYIDQYDDSQIITYYNNRTETSTTYHSLSACGIDIFADNMLFVTQAEIGKYDIKPISTKKYLPFTNMGFLPLMDENALYADYKVTDMSKSTFAMMEKYRTLKLQPVAEPNDIDDGIKYIYALPYMRVFEDEASHHLKNFSELSSPYAKFSQYNNIKVYPYNAVHAFESQNPKDIGADLYEPYNVRSYLATHQDVKLQLKVSEEYNAVTAMTTSPYLQHQIPWLISGDLPAGSITPGGEQTEKSNPDHTSIFNVVKSDSYPLSVSWFKYYMNEENDSSYNIKLDFNTPYYNNQINANLPNYHNYQHTFLNLDYPGAAGWLKIYKPEIANATQPDDFNKESYIDNVYYIKNISDTKPKFLLSAMNYEQVNIEATLLNTTSVDVDEMTGISSCVPLAVSYDREEDGYTMLATNIT